ncbi:MAG: DUF4430 domain-containing protein [Eubacterium sp.]|nr:DUF4430 domain-containing protein [Eubacterium sp.]
MKKIWIAIVLILCLSITGCGNKGETKKSGHQCTIYVECTNAIKSKQLSQELQEFLPENGIILEAKEVTFQEGDSVYDVLERTMKEEGILMEASFTGDLAYIEGIDNLYEFECGDLSGWMYCVNEKYPNVGCSGYQVKDGDRIDWHYTCDLGKDLGQEYKEN